MPSHNSYVFNFLLEEDIDQLTELCAKFHKEMKTPFSLNQRKLRNFFIDVHSGKLPHISVIVAYHCETEEVVGLIVGAIVSPLFSTDKLASELLFFVHPSHRGIVGPTLLRMFEEWAKNEQSDFTSLTNLSLEFKVDSFYKRNHYNLSERSYLKGLH